MLALAAGSIAAHGQVSGSAYRVLGQLGLQQNGLNLIQGLELNNPAAMAVDNRGGSVRIYISDTGNNRVLGWPDARSYQNGDAPVVVLGQPGPQYSGPYGIGAKGLNSPVGLAVDPSTGNLYVADFLSNRVLRFPNPFANPTRAEPDAVYGQPNFSGNGAGLSKTAMNRPRSVAFDPAGNMWVSDSSNHRILRFPASVLDSPTTPEADVVIGQKDFISGGANASQSGVSASGLDTPFGITFDGAGNLYVADYNNTRVLKFTGPFAAGTAGASASGIWGQVDYRVRGVPAQSTSSTLRGPTGVATDPNNLYVATPGDNRVLIFPLTPDIAGVAKTVIGQVDFSTTTANASVSPRASQNTLSAPNDVKVDASGNVYVADVSNSRVLFYPAGTKSAAKVWGQVDFTSNGPNQVKPVSINAPYKMAIDYSSVPYALYVSDVGNNRVLVWRDSVRFRNGDPADFAIGQPDLFTAAANVDSRGGQSATATSLSAPAGIAVSPVDGTLYVADSGNNRVLRYPRPVTQTGRITPDAVLGQSDFTSSTSAVVTASSMHTPSGLAIGPDGNIFVGDTGNNRVLEFSAGSGTGSAAVRVYGQPSFNSSVAAGQVSAQTLIAPRGLFVDASYNLYVADTGANRVMIFPNTQSAPPAGQAAAFVIGQSGFDVALVGGTSFFRGVTDVALDSNGSIYAVDTGNNRVLIFQSLVFLPSAGGAPTGVVGQKDLSGTSPNWNSSSSLATPEGLFAPIGIYLDRLDTLYVSDPGNNRVLHFLKAATVVNAARLESGVPVAPGGITTLFGTGLTDTTETAPAAPWPTKLAKRELVVNDQLPAPMYFMNATQVNFQLPQSSPLGTARMAVRVAETGELVAGGTLAVSSASPGLFTISQDGKGQAAALNQDGRVNSAANPAARGSIVTFYGTGQGQVSPPVADGVAAGASPLSSTVAVLTSDARTCLASQPSMCVAIGASFGEIQFSGLAPGFVGLWQINVKVPQDIVTGNSVGVRVLINGVPSNLISIAVK